MDGNPYSVPSGEVLPPSTLTSDSDNASSNSFAATAREIFLAWEKLRLFYVGVLAVVTLALGAMIPNGGMASARFWIVVVEGAIFSNVCFFAGPIVETYLAWLDQRPNWLRIAMFLAGTTVSILIVLVVLAGQLLPSQS